MRVASTWIVGAVTAVLMAVGSPPARAQFDSREAIALQNEILDLRHQLQLLQQGRPAASYSDRNQAGGAGVDPGLLSQLLDRVSTLEEQVRQLRGRVDELANTQQQQAADFTKQLGDLQFAMQNSGGRPPSAPPAQSSYLSPAPSMLGASAVAAG